MSSTVKPYTAPSGGWGSVRSLGNIVAKQRVPMSGPLVMLSQNKPGGFSCVSCAWIKPAKPNTFEFCENGAKATAWEITPKRTTPEFFAAHTCAELETWTDHALEDHGRLTHPMRWNAATDKYVPVSWARAFAEIGRELRAMPDRDGVVFYASGRASLETTYMYALLARMYGNNNLPDSSNMCHEPTSVALPKSIGVPKGTVTLEDFDNADCLMFFGQNPGSNSPRMLNELQKARRRGVPIITFNPLRERALEEFRSPQHVREMVLSENTRISTQYHQVKIGGDTAAITGLCKAVFALDDARGDVIDRAFVAEHTHGFEAFEAFVRGVPWAEIEWRSGLSRTAIEAAGAKYANARATIAIYGMGLTQHKTGVDNINALCNLLLMKGNIGRLGAGVCPVRGHSNVQGQRTVGMTEKPELAPNENLRTQFGFEPPMHKGLNTVEACEGILNGTVRAMIQLGGNLVRAVPDIVRMDEAWRRLRLTVTISTKLNRSHLIHGEISYILPTIGRIEIDEQATGKQFVTMEDTSACIHTSHGQVPPASRHLLSEPAIVAGIAKATLDANPRVNWDAWVGDYGLVRDAIEASYPALFHDFNARVDVPGGFHLPLKARHREWATDTGRANFIVPNCMVEDYDVPGEDVFMLMTLRSNDQFNTTIYGNDDRFRGIKDRMAVLMNRSDMARRGLAEADRVAITTAIGDDHIRRVEGFVVTPYNIPDGCVGAYYPEANALIPVWHHADGAFTPAAKGIPVRIDKMAA